MIVALRRGAMMQTTEISRRAKSSLIVSGRILAGLLFGMGIAGCGGEGLSGEYRDPRGVTGYEFEPDGRVFISVMGTMTATNYTLEGDRVLIGASGGMVVLRRKGEELEGPMGIKLIRMR